MRDFADLRFDPFEEGDIQCYLYHLILEELKDPQLVHAESPYKTKQGQRIPQFIDILVGPYRKNKPGVESVPVEIKVSYLSNWTKVPKSWKSDVMKLVMHYKKRQPIFGLFIVEKRPWNPVRRDNVTRQQLQIIEDFGIWAKAEHHVKVLSPFAE